MEVIHLGCAQLTVTYIGLIYKELYIGIKFLVDDALELVGSNCRRHCSGIGKSGGSHNTVGHLNARKSILLTTLTHCECQAEIALNHLGIVVIANGDGHCTATVVADYRIVTAHLLALECVGGRCDFGSVEFKVGSHRNLSILHKEFSRDFTCNGCGHLFTHHLKRIGIDREVISSELIHLLATTCKN